MGSDRQGLSIRSTIADGFNGFAVHLGHHDVMLMAVSRAPFAKLQGKRVILPAVEKALNAQWRLMPVPPGGTACVLA